MLLDSTNTSRPNIRLQNVLSFDKSLEVFRSLNLGSRRRPVKLATPQHWHLHASFQSTPDGHKPQGPPFHVRRSRAECHATRDMTRRPGLFRPTYGENSRSFFGLASKSAAAVALFTGRPSKIRVKCELTIQIKTTNKFWREGEWEAGERNNGHHRCSGGKSLKGAASPCRVCPVSTN